MARKSVQIKRIDYPFSFPGTVLCVDAWEKEIQDIIEHSGERSRIIAALKTRVRFLAERGHKATRHPQWFEKLKGADDLYSMHVVTVHNIRIIYAFVKEKPVLLYAFEEKAGKNSGKNSYDTAIEISRARLDELLRRSIENE